MVQLPRESGAAVVDAAAADVAAKVDIAAKVEETKLPASAIVEEIRFIKRMDWKEK